ncbi:tail fiber assembly protein [Desulfovibrio sp. Huiquan2017]|uniref:tail fiber assembly protein n=1 Tax=Desulfovibrio sp. Huiquan2017 TaxID=2816861 RepID=UPI001A92A4CE|nr:tail fiber assembly protein [Desulfovibrio sp. Huiquan2017]
MRMYAKVGTNEMLVGGDHPGDGWVAVTAMRPGDYYTVNGEGEWSQDSDLLSEAVRAERDRRLAACDWTQMPDAPLDDTARAAWTVYRQALRDVPQQEGFPWVVVWPVGPAG